jgi:predicted secreted protein
MSVATGIMVYIVIWWIVLFTVLPWGAHPPEHPEPGHATSAPERPRLLLKFAVTTVIAAIVFAALYWFIDQGFVSFRDAA